MNCPVIQTINSIQLISTELVENNHQKRKVLWDGGDEEKYRELILHKDLPILDNDQQIDNISNSNAQKTVYSVQNHRVER